MNIDAINTFLMLAETGNFSRVGNKFSLTQSTISARIKVLEDDLGVSLFERTPTGVYLTAEGKKFYAHALTIRQAWQQGKSELAKSSRHRESLGLGLHMTMWSRFMPQWLLWMQDRNNELTLQVEADYSERLVDYIAQGVLDIALIHMPSGSPGMVVEAFSEDELVMVAREPLDFSACDEDNYIFVDWSYGYREEHQEKLPQLDTARFNIGYWEIALSHVKSSDSYAYIPEVYVDADIKAGRLHAVKGAPKLSRPSFLVYPESAANSELTLLAIEGLRESITY